MNEAVVRQNLVDMLNEPHAHLMFDEAVTDFPREKRGALPNGFTHTAWQLLEHLRIAQWDILEFSRNPDHVSPDWPSGYWPETPAPPDDTACDSSIVRFRADLTAMTTLISDPGSDLFAPILHGDGQTLLREAIVLAKHNSYHIGQLVLLKKAFSK